MYNVCCTVHTVQYVLVFILNSYTVSIVCSLWIVICTYLHTYYCKETLYILCQLRTYCVYMCTVQCLLLYILCVHVYCTVCVVHTVRACVLYSVLLYILYIHVYCTVCVVHTYCAYMCTVQCLLLYILCVHVYCTVCVVVLLCTHLSHRCTVQCVLLYYSAHICPTGVLYSVCCCTTLHTSVPPVYCTVCVVVLLCTHLSHRCTVQCVLLYYSAHICPTGVLYSVCCCTTLHTSVPPVYCTVCVVVLLCTHLSHRCTVQCVVVLLCTRLSHRCTVQCVLLYYSAHICPTGVLCPPDTKVLLGSVRRDVLTKMVRNHMKPVRDHKRRILANTTGCVHNKCSYVPPEIMHTYSTCMSI